MKIKSKLDTWVREGLLSADTAASILEFENGRGSRPWVIYGIAGVGVSTIVTGVVSLVAANWASIPPEVKLGLYFLIQGVCGWAFYRKAHEPGLLREVSLGLFMLLFFAGIGLTAQIFHLHGDGWGALLFWLVLTLPVVLMARSWPPSHLWIVILQIMASIWSVRGGMGDEALRMTLVFSLPILIAAFGLWGESFPRFSNQFKRATVFWGFGNIVIGGSIAGNLLWATFGFRGLSKHLPYLWIPWLCIGLAVAGSLVRKRFPMSLRVCTALLIVVTGLYLNIPLWMEGSRSQGDLYRVLGCLGFLSVWALAAASSAIIGYRRLFDIASLVIAVRFIIVYFEIFGNMTTTGLGLIFSGGVILGIAFAWYRYRKNVEQWLGARTQ